MEKEQPVQMEPEMRERAERLGKDFEQSGRPVNVAALSKLLVAVEHFAESARQAKFDWKQKYFREVFYPESAFDQISGEYGHWVVRRVAEWPAWEGGLGIFYPGQRLFNRWVEEKYRWIWDEGPTDVMLEYLHGDPCESTK